METYDEKWAENYKRLATASIAGREGLYRLCSAYLSKLPDKVRILVVGCGTGEELIALAKALPLAEFEAIDPSEPMLKMCSKSVEEEGLSKRITLHNSTLNDFTSAHVFDAATAILVSQHLNSDALAQGFFNQIAGYLKPCGLLYSADLHIGTAQNRELIFDLWHRNVIAAGIEKEMADGMLLKIKTDICIREEKTITGFIQSAGFNNIFMPFRSLMYGAWAAEKSA